MTTPASAVRSVFLEVIEWFDETGREIIHRVPEEGSGEIKYGAQLTVRESQAAVLFYQGRAYDAFGPGRHTLKTLNIPILTKVASIPWGMTSPLRAEVVFANMKVFTNLKWGTRDPVAFRDQELGLVRLRAFGVFNLRIQQPVLFINSLAGTQGIFSTTDIEEYLGRVIVSRFNDHLGEHLDTLLNLPGRYEELSHGLTERLQQDFRQFGLDLTQLYINSVTPPPEVQQALDDRSRLGVFDDLSQLMKLKAAMALEKAAGSEGGAGTGLGLGMGLLVPGLFAGALRGLAGGEAPGGGNGGAAAAAAATEAPCPECAHPVPAEARFCPACGHQIVVFDRCTQCGKNLGPGAKFCPRCGKATAEKAAPRTCPHCRAENLSNSVYCNQCGQKLD